MATAKDPAGRTPLVGKFADNKVTGALVKVLYENDSGGVYVAFVEGYDTAFGPTLGRHTWFRADDLKDYRDAP